MEILKYTKGKLITAVVVVTVIAVSVPAIEHARTPADATYGVADHRWKPRSAGKCVPISDVYEFYVLSTNKMMFESKAECEENKVVAAIFSAG